MRRGCGMQMTSRCLCCHRKSRRCSNPTYEQLAKVRNQPDSALVPSENQRESALRRDPLVRRHALTGLAAVLAIMVCLRPALGNAQNSPPSFIVPASIDIQHYDNDNDLLTAGKKWSDFPDEANAP